MPEPEEVAPARETPRISYAEWHSWNPGVKRLLTETVGTFGLVAVAGLADVAGFLTGGEVTAMARAIAPGLFVMAMIYAIGDVSGLHINPAVTLGFTVRRRFPARWLAAYWVAQLVGAVVAGFGLVVVFGNDAASHAVTEPHGIEPWVALVLEIFLTWALVTVVLGTADRAHLVGPNAAIAVGATIILCGLVALPLEGASMNPARSTGPALATGDLSSLWIYWLGPLVGALIAVAFGAVVHSERHDEEKAIEAAAGKRG
ncbi:MAG TPA: aquaporin [Candidatus Limnocylindrales bacterium]